MSIIECSIQRILALRLESGINDDCGLCYGHKLLTNDNKGSYELFFYNW